MRQFLTEFSVIFIFKDIGKKQSKYICHGLHMNQCTCEMDFSFVLVKN